MPDGRFQIGRAHPRAIDLEERLRLLQGMDTGTLILTHIRRGERSRMEVRSRCRACRATRYLDATNVHRGLTTTCRCQRRVKYKTKGERQLAERYDAAYHRCNFPSDPSYHKYGGRGIKMLFPSREGYVRYIYDRWPREDYSGLDIDRLFNDGHYEVGNVGPKTRRENLLNRRNTKTMEFEGREIPCDDLWFLLRERHPEFRLARGTTARLARQGVSAEDILRRVPRPRRDRVRQRVRPSSQTVIRHRNRPSTGT